MEKLTSEVLGRLYRPVGEIIVQWAIIDSSLHHLAFAMFHHIGTTPKAQGWPHFFGHRLDRLEDMFKKRREFSSFSKDAKQILKDIGKHQRMRDMLAHGVAVRYHREKDGVLFQRVDRSTQKQLKRQPDRTHRNSEMLLRFTMLEVASSNCTILARAVLAIRAAVLDLGTAK